MCIIRNTIHLYISTIFQSLYRNEGVCELEGVHIANFEYVIFFQAVLNIVVYQMLIVANVPVNIAVL